MILVNNPGEWGTKSQYWPLDHAEWHGWTPTDLIFPFFLFIVGTALAYSLRKYRDGAEFNRPSTGASSAAPPLLIFLGWMPTLLLKTIAATHGAPFDLSNLRIFGVLVRIAIVYFFTSLIVLHIPLRGQVVLGVVILLGYWAAARVPARSARLPEESFATKATSRSSSIAPSSATNTCTTAIRPPNPKAF